MYAIREFFDTWNVCDHFDAMQKKIFSDFGTNIPKYTLGII